MGLSKRWAQFAQALKKAWQGLCHAPQSFRRWWREDWDQRNRWLWWVCCAFVFIAIAKFIHPILKVVVIVAWGMMLLALLDLHRFPHLIRLLASSKETVRTKTFAELIRQGEKAVPILLRALSVPEVAIGWDGSLARMLAAFGLGRLKAKEGVEPLMALLQDSFSWTGERIAAIWALGEIGDQKAIPALLPFLGDFRQTYKTEERLIFLEGLPAHGKERMLKWDWRWRWRIVNWAFDALAKLGAQNLVDGFHRVLNQRDEEALQRLKTTFRSEVTSAFMKLLDTYQYAYAPRFWEAEKWVCHAAWALGKLGALEAIGNLRREARRSPFPTVREICGQVLKELEIVAGLPTPASAAEIDRANLPAIPDPKAIPTDTLPRPVGAAELDEHPTG